jgi:hypothetical protein
MAYNNHNTTLYTASLRVVIDALAVSAITCHYLTALLALSSVICIEHYRALNGLEGVLVMKH